MSQDPRIEAAAKAARIAWSGHDDWDGAPNSVRIAYRGLATAALAATDKAATITEAYALAEVPAGTVVRSAAGTIAARFDGYTGVMFGDDRGFPWRDLALPATILHWGTE